MKISEEVIGFWLIKIIKLQTHTRPPLCLLSQGTHWTTKGRHILSALLSTKADGTMTQKLPHSAVEINNPFKRQLIYKTYRSILWLNSLFPFPRRFIVIVQLPAFFPYAIIVTHLWILKLLQNLRPIFNVILIFLYYLKILAKTILPSPLISSFGSTLYAFPFLISYHFTFLISRHIRCSEPLTLVPSLLPASSPFLQTPRPAFLPTSFPLPPTRFLTLQWSCVNVLWHNKSAIQPTIQPSRLLSLFSLSDILGSWYPIIHVFSCVQKRMIIYSIYFSGVIILYSSLALSPSPLLFLQCRLVGWSQQNYTANEWTQTVENM